MLSRSNSLLMHNENTTLFPAPIIIPSDTNGENIYKTYFKKCVRDASMVNAIMTLSTYPWIELIISVRSNNTLNIFVWINIFVYSFIFFIVFRLFDASPNHQIVSRKHIKLLVFQINIGANIGGFIIYVLLFIGLTSDKGVLEDIIMRSAVYGCMLLYVSIRMLIFKCRSLI